MTKITRVVRTWAAVIGVWALVVSVCSAQPAESKTEKPSDDEAAIRAAIESYTAAYNRGDAKGVAEHWSEGAEWISPAGAKIRGRAAIEQALTAMFANIKGIKVEVIEPSVRFVTPDVAVEEGTVTVTRPGEDATASTYMAIHVKQGGQWKLNSVRETEVPIEAFERDGLDQLEWLIGDWVDSGPDSTVETKFGWTKNGTFITASFRVVTSAENDLEGTLVIGWDPVALSVRSWMFDSDGGFGEGTWRRRGDRWIVSLKQTLADGSEASSTNIYRRIDENSYGWQSIERRLNGESLPDIKEVKVVRAVQPSPQSPEGGEKAPGKAQGNSSDKPNDKPAAKIAPAVKPAADGKPAQPNRVIGVKK